VEITCRVYRPGRCCESPLFQIVERHLEELLRVWPVRFARQHGPLRAVVERVLREFLRCGLLEHGFARLWCPECRRSVLVAFSCRGRWFWQGLGHLQTSEVGAVLESTVRRIERHLRRRGLLWIDEDGAGPDVPVDPESNLAASAVSGQTPPAGPQWVSGLQPLAPHPLAYDKPLCTSLDGFTLHAATRAGALDPGGREALLRYVLRPPIAQERLEPRPDGLVRITLKKAYTDGTVAVDMDPLSLLCRLATSVPAPRFHSVRYAGVLAAASPWRPRIAPKPPTEEPAAASAEPDRTGPAGGYRPWAELLARTFAVDVLRCPSCQGRMRLLAVIQEPASIARYLAAVGEATEVPRRSPGRGPPYWKSQVLRRQVLEDEQDCASHGDGADEAAWRRWRCHKGPGAQSSARWTEPARGDRPPPLTRGTDMTKAGGRA
jgi:hypothetical protein